MKRYEQESSVEEEDEGDDEEKFEMEKDPVKQTFLRIMFAEGDFRRPDIANIPTLVAFLKEVISRFKETESTLDFDKCFFLFDDKRKKVISHRKLVKFYQITQGDEVKIKTQEDTDAIMNPISGEESMDEESEVEDVLSQKSS